MHQRRVLPQQWIAAICLEELLTSDCLKFGLALVINVCKHCTRNANCVLVATNLPSEFGENIVTHNLPDDN